MLTQLLTHLWLLTPIGRGVDAIKNGGKIIGAGGAGGDWDSIYENDQSDKVRDPEKGNIIHLLTHSLTHSFTNLLMTAAELFKLATQVTGAEWPAVKGAVSPCPTLRVIGFITKLLGRNYSLTHLLTYSLTHTFITTQMGNKKENELETVHVQ